MMLPLIWAGDYVHLILLYPFYRYEIGDAPKKSFAWPLFGVAGGPVQARTLVYDTTPETASQLGTRSAMIEGIGGPVKFTTTRLIGNFFLRELIIE